MRTGVIIYGVMILLFAGFGILFALGKGRGLIAGYNTMSEAERAKYDEKKLMRIMRNGMFTMAGCTAVSLIGVLIKSKPVMWAGYVMIFAVAVVLVVLTNTAAKR